jgi:hypothetical protein
VTKATYFAVVLAAALRGAASDDPAPTPYEPKAAYEVYQAALKNQGHSPFLVADTTRPISQCLDLTEDQAVDQAIENYKVVNQKQWRLKSDAPFGKLLRTSHEIERLKPAGANNKLFWSYAGHVYVLYLSAVGFDRKGTTAFMELIYTCGGQCGGGSPVILRKQGNQWKQYIPQPPPNPDGTSRFASSCLWNY